MVGRVADGNGLLNRQRVMLVRGFESLTILLDSLAQLVEHRTFNPRVVGAKPTRVIDSNLNLTN